MKIKMKERRLVVVDAENIAGGGIRDAGAAAWVRKRLTAAGAVADGDLVVVGTDGAGCLPIARGWLNVRYVVGYGRDGADLALLEVLGESVPERFTRVVVASGDHIFTDRVTALVDAGVNVTVIGRRGHTSYVLASAASETRYMDGSYYPQSLAAETAQVAA